MIKKQWLVYTILLTGLFINSAVFSQTIIYVDSSATGLNNGQSWQNAYKNLDSALLHATGFTANDSIKIAKGTYRPSRIPGAVSTGDPRDVTFYISFNGTLSGGYSSGGTVLNHDIYPTILSGDIGVKGDSLDNAYHVLVINGLSVKIGGITITGGNANGADSLQTGTGNIPRFNGGGIYFMNASANLQEIVAENNYGFYGGGFYNNGSNINVTNAVFDANNSERGGALYNSPSSSATLNNLVVYNNSADDAGGGILNDNATIYVINNCSFVANFTFQNEGAAIYNTQSNYSNSSITNCLFSGNYDFGDPNTVGDPAVDLIDSAGTATASYCVFQEWGYPGNNNYSTADAALANINNPKGADNTWASADDGLSITVQSPAFKHGGNGLVNFDITNAPRNLSTGFDIGAYEIGSCGQFTGRTVYVDSAATGNSSGSSWPNAFTSLQAAINLVRSGCADTIKVAAGTYMPTENLRGVTANPSSFSGYVFQLPSNITILGGYSHGGSAVAEPVSNKTILFDKNNVGSLILAGNVSNVTLRGLYIQNGDASYSSGDSVSVNGVGYSLSDGGGMLAENSEIQMSDCIFENNYAGNDGGGLALINSIFKIKRCSFESNRSTYEGGGMYIVAAGAGSLIDSSYFSNNLTLMFGGGFAIEQNSDSLTISNTRFTGNYTTVSLGNVGGGGGLYSASQTPLTISKCVFDSNKAFYGGALYLDDGSLSTISKSYFFGDTATQSGGAIRNRGTVFIYTSIFSGNNAANIGGALYAEGTSYIYFSDFVRNNAAVEGGAIDGEYTYNAYNSIFWANTVADDSLRSTADVNGANYLNYCSLQVYPPSQADGNISGFDPFFVNINNIVGPDGILGTTDDGLNLKLTSPVVNDGRAQYDTTIISTDIDGSPRWQSIYPDMGAYEIDYCGLSGFTNHTVYVDSSVVGGNKTGNSWANAYTDLESALRAYRSGCGDIDTIKVAKGTYVPSAAAGYLPYDPVTSHTFNIPDSLVLLGGYPSGGGVRDYHQNETILKGGGTVHTVTMNNIVTGFIDGFTIENGYGDNTNGLGGGGVNANNSAIDIRNTIIQENLGSGLYLNYCTGKLTNCIIDNNEGAVSGGVYNIYSPVEYDNCIFSNNTASGGVAGAVAIPYTTDILPSFKNCTFYDNQAEFSGAISSGNTPIIVNCLFWGNYASGMQFTDISKDELSLATPDGRKISYSLFQIKSVNYSGIHCLYGINPSFSNIANIKGPDNIWGTADDGLRQADSSYAINNGINDSIPASVTTDITGAPRINSGVVDIGAYEYDCGFTNFTNSLVPIGSAEVVSNTFNTCGTWQFLTSTTDPSKYIIEVDPNGNSNFTPVQIKIDVTNTQLHIATNGTGDTTALAYRMVSIDAPGQYPVNGGIKIRIYYDPAELDTLPGAIHYWFKHTAHDKSTVLADLSSDTLLNEVPIIPSSYGIINGIHYVEFDSLTSFSTFGYLGATHNGALPLQFLSFTAQWSATDKVDLLNWVTAEEINVKSFEVQRSANGNVWYEQDSLSANQSPAQSHSYQWTDTHPLSGLSYYRIKQIDNDGRSTFSIIRKIDNSNENSVFEILPNPAKNIATIKLEHLTPVVNYTMTDAAGRAIQRGAFYNTSTIFISLINQATGIYYVTINNKTQKLVVSK